MLLTPLRSQLWASVSNGGGTGTAHTGEPRAHVPLRLIFDKSSFRTQLNYLNGPRRSVTPWEDPVRCVSD